MEPIYREITLIRQNNNRRRGSLPRVDQFHPAAFKIRHTPRCHSRPVQQRNRRDAHRPARSAAPACCARRRWPQTAPRQRCQTAECDRGSLRPASTPASPATRHGACLRAATPPQPQFGLSNRTNKTRRHGLRTNPCHHPYIGHRPHQLGHHIGIKQNHAEKSGGGRTGSRG